MAKANGANRNSRDEVPSWVEFPEERGPVGREGYGRIPFEGLWNTRDLGGLVGADGRCVKPGLLLRSGTLGFGTEADLARLCDEYRVRLVVDLRNDTELAELPDPMDLLPGARFLHASILVDTAAGITREQEAAEALRRRIAAGEESPLALMELVYPHLLLDDAGLAGYRAFFQAVLDCTEGAALWHCFVGRDRCGMAAVLMETALGVAWEDIESDYLATNFFAPMEYTGDSPASLRSLGAVTRAVGQAFGGYEGYLREGLGLTAGDIAELRARYLETV